MDADEKRRKRTEYMRRFRADNLERERQRQREYRAANPDKVAAWETARAPRKPRVGRAHLVGERATAWKGDAAGRGAMHRWIQKERGKPSLCEHCGTTTAKQFDWANKDHAYRRNVDDWMRLCHSCHFKYDWRYNGRPTPPRKRE